jgi:hypothetical protein
MDRINIKLLFHPQLPMQVPRQVPRQNVELVSIAAVKTKEVPARTTEV